MMSFHSYVLGHEAMKKMSHANVLISGMKGLGVEIGECRVTGVMPHLLRTSWYLFSRVTLVPRLLRGRSKEPGTHCLRMLSYPRISGALETSGYYAAISLRLSSYYRSLHAYN